MSGIDVKYSLPFNLPTLTSPNGSELLRTEYQIAEALQGLESSYDLYSIIGLAMTHEDLICMLGYRAGAYRDGSGWAVELPRDGVRLRGDAVLSGESIVTEAMPVLIGTPTLCQPPEGGEAPAAFWTNFALSLEDEFGGAGATGWVPDDEVIVADAGLAGIYNFMGGADGVYGEPEGGEGAISGIYIANTSTGSIELFINMSDVVAPVSATLRIDAFGSFVLPLDSIDEGMAGFYVDELDFVGIELIACQTPVAVKLNYS